MIILIGSQKGGTGKSTIAVNLTIELQKRTNKVLLLDADPQGSSNKWTQNREDLIGKKNVRCLQKTGKIRQTLQEIKPEYDYIIVDTAGHDSRELRNGLTVADLLLVPTKASQFDIDTLVRLSEIVDDAKDLSNPKLKTFLLINMAPTNHKNKNLKDAQEILKEFDSFKLLENQIYHRNAYINSISEGLGVVEMSDLKAKQEIENLTRTIIEELNSKKPGEKDGYKIA